MTRYITVSIISGLLFAIMDGLINANPIAQNLYSVYQPIMRSAINPVTGTLIDLFFGFMMAGIYLILNKNLPGTSGLAKGAYFGLLVWFFRTSMNTASQWVMFQIPTSTVLYSLASGLIEMLVLGMLYGATLQNER